MENLTGRWLAGRYNLQQFLGRGSIGDVYKAWDRQRAIHLSLKLLQLDLAEDKLFLSNFQRDTQALIRLQHTYIVGFYGLEQADGLVFLLMDYIEGSTLGLEIPRVNGPFTMTQAMFILRPVCAALHYAHQMGVMHGDLKPANILIHRKGTVLITDVGVKRMVEAASSSSRHFPGSLAYMAPEQIRGQACSARSDIYALGVVLYEMLTGGKRPFEGEQAKISGSTDERISWEQVNLAPPSLRRLNPAIPAKVEAAVMRCLEKQPEQRFEKPMELLDALEGSYQEPAGAARPPVVQSAAAQPTGSLRPPAPQALAQSTANLRPPVADKPGSPPVSSAALPAAKPASAPLNPKPLVPERLAQPPASPVMSMPERPVTPPASPKPAVPEWTAQPPSIAKPVVPEKPATSPSSHKPDVPEWNAQPPSISKLVAPEKPATSSPSHKPAVPEWTAQPPSISKLVAPEKPATSPPSHKPAVPEWTAQPPSIAKPAAPEKPAPPAVSSKTGGAGVDCATALGREAGCARKTCRASGESKTGSAGVDCATALDRKAGCTGMVSSTSYHLKTIRTGVVCRTAGQLKAGSQQLV